MATRILSISGLRGVIGDGLDPIYVTEFAAALGTMFNGGKVVISKETFRMYVCICNALKDRELAEAAAQPGVRSAACVFKHCQTKPKCGNCVADIDEMIAERQSSPALYAAE